MDMLLDLFAIGIEIFYEHVYNIFRMGRQIPLTSNEICLLARKGNRHFSSWSNNPSVLTKVSDSPNANETKVMAAHLTGGEALKTRVAIRDKVSASGIQASNGGNLYGGNGTKGTKKASNDAELLGENDSTGRQAGNLSNLSFGSGNTGIARNRWILNDGNGTFGKRVRISADGNDDDGTSTKQARFGGDLNAEIENTERFASNPGELNNRNGTGEQSNIKNENSD